MRVYVRAGEVYSLGQESQRMMILHFVMAGQDLTFIRSSQGYEDTFGVCTACIAPGLGERGLRRFHAKHVSGLVANRNDLAQLAG